MKYIATKDPFGIEEVFTFPISVDHDAMAEMLACIKNHTHGNWHRVRRQPISAGFVDSVGNCFGSSTTLGLSARDVDSAILARQLSVGFTHE